MIKVEIDELEMPSEYLPRLEKIFEELTETEIVVDPFLSTFILDMYQFTHNPKDLGLLFLKKGDVLKIGAVKTQSKNITVYVDPYLQWGVSSIFPLSKYKQVIGSEDLPDEKRDIVEKLYKFMTLGELKDVLNGYVAKTLRSE